MRDTRPEAAAVLIEATRRRAPIDRLLDALRLSDALRAVALDALRRRRPGADAATLFTELSGEPMNSRVRHGPVTEA